MTFLFFFGSLGYSLVSQGTILVSGGYVYTEITLPRYNSLSYVIYSSKHGGLLIVRNINRSFTLCNTDGQTSY